MRPILKIAQKNKIKIIEDCAQSHGSKYKNKKVGSFGEISCFSFYATKHMTTGEGIFMFSKKYNLIAKKFRNHGLRNRDEHEMLGYNYRMNEIAGIMGNIQLKSLDKINKKRINNSIKIINELNKIKQIGFKLNQLNLILYILFWLPIRIVNSKIKLHNVIKYFSKNNVELRHRYKYPLYRHPLFKKIKNNSQNYSKLYLKNSEALAGNIFGLPNHHKLSKIEILKIVKLMKNLEKNIDR